jgi:hypothetical protein
MSKAEYNIGDLVLWNGDDTQSALILKIEVDQSQYINTELTMYTVLVGDEILKYPDYVMFNWRVVSSANSL